MAIGPTANRVSGASLAPFGARLRALRQRVRQALHDDWENPRAPLDAEDLAWLADLPSNLPRGSILNIVV